MRRNPDCGRFSTTVTPSVTPWRQRRDTAVLTHGEAVALGMVGEAMLAEESGLCPPVSERIARLLSAFGLPTRLTLELTDEELLERMRRDKKVRTRKLTFVLPRGIGRVDRSDGLEEVGDPPGTQPAERREKRDEPAWDSRSDDGFRQ